MEAGRGGGLRGAASAAARMPREGCGAEHSGAGAAMKKDEWLFEVVQQLPDYPKSRSVVFEMVKKMLEVFEKES